MFWILLENDTEEKIFYDNLHPVELISKIIQMISMCSSPSKTYKRDVEMVGEAANTLRALLMSCGNISDDSGPMDINADKRDAVTSLMEEMISKTSDLCSLLTYHLKKALQGEVDRIVSANKIVAFIRVLLEMDSFLQKSLSPGGSLPWNIEDRFSSPSFVEDILVKLLEKEISFFKTTHLINETSWQLTLRAIVLYSWDEARVTSVYLRKRHSIHRIRILLQVLSACLQADALNSKLSAIADLASEGFGELLKEFPHIAVNPARNLEAFRQETNLLSQRTADLNSTQA